MVCSTICSGSDQRKHQSSMPLTFVRGIHQSPVNSPYKGPVKRKMFPFDDVIMNLGILSVAMWTLSVDTILTHLPLDKMAAILQTTFWNAFSWMKKFIFGFKFHWSLFLRVQLIVSELWYRQWLGAEQVTSNYLSQCWPSLWTHICGRDELMGPGL